MAVSYTHLDVYKRQVEGGSHVGIIALLGGNYEGVSMCPDTKTAFDKQLFVGNLSLIHIFFITT